MVRPEPATTAPFNLQKDRYIYTEKGGWIDMAHFMFYAGRSFGYKQEKKSAQKNISDLSKDPMTMSWVGQGLQTLYKLANQDPVGKAVQDGYKQEMTDRFVARHSAYSYEDLPSDKMGADFGANYFNPKSKLSLGQQIANYLKRLGATDPSKAPNYKSLPEVEPEHKPTRTNHNTKPVYTKENL